MYYRTYNVVQEGQQGRYDYAIIPENEMYRFFQYNDECSYKCLSCEEPDEDYRLSHIPQGMRYYVETKKGIQLFFRQEKNMWKWLYEHSGEFQIESYGRYSA